MRDLNFVREDGTKIPVAQMDTTDIVECLRDGYEAVEDGLGGDVTERLRIELLIRELGL